MKLEELFSHVENGKSITKLKRLKKGYPVYGSGEVLFFSDKYLYDKECLIIGRVGNCGVVQIGKPPLWASDNTIVCFPKPEYNIYFIKSLLERINLQNFQNGSANPLLTATVIKNIEIQTNSSHIINNNLGFKIENIENLIDNNNQKIHVLFNKIKDQYSYYLSTCSNTKKLTLSDLIKEENNKSTKSSKNILIDLACLPSSSMSIYMFNDSDKLTTNKNVLSKGNILIGLIRPYLRKCVISPVNGVTTGTIGQFKIKEDSFKSFVIGVITNNSFFKYLDSASTGTKMPVIKCRDILNFEFPWDKEAILNCKFDNKYFDEVINLNIQNFKLSKLKKLFIEKMIN